MVDEVAAAPPGLFPMLAMIGRPPGDKPLMVEATYRLLTMPSWPEVSCGPGAVGEDRHVQGYERLRKIWQRFSLLSADH